MCMLTAGGTESYHQSTMGSAEHEVWAENSDEEGFDQCATQVDDGWDLNPDLVVELNERITASKVLEFSWICPGRKIPGQDERLEEKPAPSTPKEAPSEKFTEYDYEDTSTPTLRPTKSSPKGSAKKKTTSFASIISNMERHRIIEQMPSENAQSLLKPEEQLPPPLRPNTSASGFVISTSDSISSSIDRVVEEAKANS